MNRRFTSLCHQLLSPCNGFEFLHSSSRSAITVCHLVHSLVEQLYASKFISAVLWQNPTVQSNMPQVFTRMYSAVSLGPSCMESLTGFSRALPTEIAFLHISPWSFWLFFATHFFSNRIVKKNSKANSYLFVPRKRSLTAASIPWITAY